MSAVPLWSLSNQTMFSDIFNVAPGKVCLLFAAGLEREKVRVDNSEFVVPQAICIRRLIHSSDVQFSKTGLCDWVVSATSASAVADDVVQTCHGCWSLTEANNVGIIGIPGTYRLELNDATAIGVAQVYAELFDANSLPLQVERLFF